MIRIVDLMTVIDERRSSIGTEEEKLAWAGWGERKLNRA